MPVLRRGAGKILLLGCGKESEEAGPVCWPGHHASAQFEKLDNLDYAVATLEQALALKPSGLDLQRQYFLLRAKPRLPFWASCALASLPTLSATRIPRSAWRAFTFSAKTMTAFLPTGCF